MRLIDTAKLNLQAEKAQLEQKIAKDVARINAIDEMLKRDAKKENWGSWNRKTLDSLRFTSQPMTTEEILNHIFWGRENELVDSEMKRKYMLKISLALIRAYKKGVLFRESINGYRGNLYGLQEWRTRPNFKNEILKKQMKIMKEKRGYTSVYM